MTAELVRHASVTGSAGEHALQHHLAERLQDAGCAVDLWPLDLADLATRPGFPGWEAPRHAGWGVVGELTGSADGPTVVLNAHVDVVPPGDLDQWTGAPFEARHDTGPDGREAVFGRGACDMKGGLVAVLATLDQLRAEGLPRRGRVVVMPVVGEEDGGLGTFATLARGHRGDVAVIPEPTSCDIVCANAGALTFALTVPGLAAHGGSRHHGVSALEKLWPLMRALDGLEAERNVHIDPLLAHVAVPYAISVGKVQAGEWASMVPDVLVAEGRFGVRLDEDVDAARAALTGAVERACAADPWLAAHPAMVKFTGGQFGSGRTAPDDPLVQVLAGAHRARTGADPRVHGAPYGSDLRLLAGAGIPTVHYGPGAITSAHAPDEWVPVEEIALSAAVLTDLVRTYCD